jgi:hypothetical protein
MEVDTARGRFQQTGDGRIMQGVDAGRVDSPGHCFARPALSTASRKEGEEVFFLN